MSSPDSRSSYGESAPLAYGVTVFAGVVLATLAGLQFLQGLAAVLKDDVFVRGVNYTYQFDVTTWGWIHLIVGIIVAVSGFGVFFGNVAARTVGVLVAMISAVAAFLWLPWYPVWAVLIIALDIAVIWALTLHGRDIALRPER
jgi:hypothetical protein